MLAWRHALEHRAASVPAHQIAGVDGVVQFMSTAGDSPFYCRVSGGSASMADGIAAESNAVVLIDARNFTARLANGATRRDPINVLGDVGLYQRVFGELG